MFYTVYSMEYLSNPPCYAGMKVKTDEELLLRKYIIGYILYVFMFVIYYVLCLNYVIKKIYNVELY